MEDILDCLVKAQGSGFLTRKGLGVLVWPQYCRGFCGVAEVEGAQSLSNQSDRVQGIGLGLRQTNEIGSLVKSYAGHETY